MIDYMGIDIYAASKKNKDLQNWVSGRRAMHAVDYDKKIFNAQLNDKKDPEVLASIFLMNIEEAKDFVDSTENLLRFASIWFGDWEFKTMLKAFRIAEMNQLNEDIGIGKMVPMAVYKGKVSSED